MGFCGSGSPDANFGGGCECYNVYVDPSRSGGYWTQVAGSGSETHSVVNPDGTITPITETDELQNGTSILNELQIQAPAYVWVLAGGPNFATLGQLVAPYDPGAAFFQTVSFGALSGVGFWAKGSAALYGAIGGAYGGYHAHGWNGVVPGAAVGAATSGLLGAYSPSTAGIGATSYIIASGAAGAGFGTLTVNAMTSGPLGAGVLPAMVVGGLAPMVSQEAVLVGGAGLGGAAEDALGAVSAAIGAIGTAIGP